VSIKNINRNKAIIKGDENNDIIQADKKEFHLMRCLLKCFQRTSQTLNSSSIEFSIKYSENLHERILELKSLNGVRTLKN
jgi:hypothetical protein